MKVQLGRIEFSDPALRPTRSLISGVAAIAAERAACEKRAAAESAELLADIGTHIHHMNIYHLRAWFQRKFGDKLDV